MTRLTLFTDSSGDAARLRYQLAGKLEVQRVWLSQLGDVPPGALSVIDVDLKDDARLPELKGWLGAKPKNARVIFVTDSASRIEAVRARALGATDVIERPPESADILRALARSVRPATSSPAKRPEPTAPDGEAAAGRRIHKVDAGNGPVAVGNSFRSPLPGVAACADAMHSLFSAANIGEPIKAASLNTAGNAVVHEIESVGLSSWIDTVRKHHNQTYQHCLLVTGAAVGFGQQLGLSQADRNRLSFAGMLHDIGKARIPLKILEKPGPLDDGEAEVMRRHPELGLEVLKDAPALQPEMIDMVVHHHEYLDGSGYPHGLQGTEISDLVRIMTIADIFGALIERRSYKPPLPGEKAYGILLDMGSKLDKDLVREFRSTAMAAKI